MLLNSPLLALSILCACGLALTYRAARRKDILTTLFTGGLTLTYLLLWISIPIVYMFSTWLELFIIAGVVASINWEKEETKRNKFLIGTLGFWAAFATYGQLNGWPYASETEVIGFIITLLFLFAFRPQHKSKYHYEYLLLICVELVVRLLF